MKKKIYATVKPTEEMKKKMKDIIEWIKKEGFEFENIVDLKDGFYRLDWGWFNDSVFLNISDQEAETVEISFSVIEDPNSASVFTAILCQQFKEIEFYVMESYFYDSLKDETFFGDEAREMARITMGEVKGKELNNDINNQILEYLSNAYGTDREYEKCDSYATNFCFYSDQFRTTFTRRILFCSFNEKQNCVELMFDVGEVAELAVSLVSNLYQTFSGIKFVVLEPHFYSKEQNEMLYGDKAYEAASGEEVGVSFENDLPEKIIN